MSENNGFAKGDVDTPSISRRDLFIIFVAGVVSASLGLFLAIPVNPNFELAPLLNSVYIVSMTFATGLFSFLTAGLLFSSRASRSYLLRRIEQVGVKRAYLVRTLHTFVITSVFSLIITIITFLQPSYPDIAFLPSVLGASLIVSICLAPIAIALAIITDDSRLCVVIGSASTYLIAIVAGGIPEDISFFYSLTRNIALLSPHNIVRALAVQFSGYQFESNDDMVGYLGFAVSAEGLAVALLILSSISIVLLLTGQRALSKNSTRWPVLKRMIIPIDEKWDATVSAEELQEINRVRRGLRLQRGLTTLIVGVLLISMVSGVSMYSLYITNTTTFNHYETPGTSENIPVGSWIIFDVDVFPPYPGLFNRLHFGYHIITLGNTSGTVSIFIGIIEMNSTEFNLLEETSRLELVRDRIISSGSGGGTGTNLEESYGSYICVMKIVSDVNPSENSYIEAALRIDQEAL